MSAVRKASAKLIRLQKKDFSAIYLPVCISSSFISAQKWNRHHCYLPQTSGTGTNPQQYQVSLNEFPFAKYFFVPLWDLSTNVRGSLLIQQLILCIIYSLMRHGCHPRRNKKKSQSFPWPLTVQKTTFMDRNKTDHKKVANSCFIFAVTFVTETGSNLRSALARALHLESSARTVRVRLLQKLSSAMN